MVEWGGAESKTSTLQVATKPAKQDSELLRTLKTLLKKRKRDSDDESDSDDEDREKKEREERMMASLRYEMLLSLTMLPSKERTWVVNFNLSKEVSALHLTVFNSWF